MYSCITGHHVVPCSIPSCGHEFLSRALFLLALATLRIYMSTYVQLVEFNVPDLCLCFFDQLSFMDLGLGTI